MIEWARESHMDAPTRLIDNPPRPSGTSTRPLTRPLSQRHINWPNGRFAIVRATGVPRLGARRIFAQFLHGAEARSKFSLRGLSERPKCTNLHKCAPRLSETRIFEELQTPEDETLHHA